MNFKFCGAASYKFNQTVRHTIVPKQGIWRFAEISSQRRAWQVAEILPQRYVQQKIEAPSQQYAQRSMRQAAEISPGQHIRQTAIIPQKRSLQRAAKILLLRHMPQGEISRAENCENSAAMRQAASRRNFIEIARMMNHQIPAENNKTLADSHKIPNESCRIIPAERGAAR